MKNKFILLSTFWIQLQIQASKSFHLSRSVKVRLESFQEIERKIGLVGRYTGTSTNKIIKGRKEEHVLLSSYSSPNPPFLGHVAINHVEAQARQDTILNVNESSEQNEAISSPKEKVYRIHSEEEYTRFLERNPDKLVVVKFFATYCRACKLMGQKLIHVKNDPQLEGLPIVWAEFAAHRSVKDLFQNLGVITLPTIHFYDGSRGLVENFPCPPHRIPLLKTKLARFINARVDPITRTLTTPTNVVESHEQQFQNATEPRVQRRIIDNDFITSEHIDFLRHGMPFFKDLTDQEFDALLEQARLLTFNPGDIIVKQGMRGKFFYVIKSGVVEMHIKSRFDDPISTPSQYLGVHVNTLEKFGYFGERALTTGEPLSASFRALSKVRCFAFHVEDIPPSSILSKKRQAAKEFVEQLNQRYVLPEDYTPSYLPSSHRDECILDLLVRFKQIRQAAKCFDYVMETSKPTWGDAGEIARRTMLVRKLSKSQRNDFNEVFDMVDVSQRGSISLFELRKFMQSARQTKTDKQLFDMINVASKGLNGRDTAILSISRDEFIGVMAEAEFYNLFKETFRDLDTENTGYVRAGDLDDVLVGVHDLIADKEYSSIIDVEDRDMLVDYEQYSKMLLGAAL